MCKEKVEEVPTFYRRQLNTLRSRTRDNLVRILSGGASREKVMEILESLGDHLKTPPHYPMRVVMELADQLEISVPHARLLWDYLVKAKMIRYSCTFEAESEKQNQTVLQVNPLPA